MGLDAYKSYKNHHFPVKILKPKGNDFLLSLDQSRISPRRERNRLRASTVNMLPGYFKIRSS